MKNYLLVKTSSGAALPLGYRFFASAGDARAAMEQELKDAAVKYGVPDSESSRGSMSSVLWAEDFDYAWAIIPVHKSEEDCMEDILASPGFCRKRFCDELAGSAGAALQQKFTDLCAMWLEEYAGGGLQGGAGHEH